MRPGTFQGCSSGLASLTCICVAAAGAHTPEDQPAGSHLRADLRASLVDCICEAFLLPVIGRTLQGCGCLNPSWSGPSVGSFSGCRHQFVGRLLNKVARGELFTCATHWLSHARQVCTCDKGGGSATVGLQSRAVNRCCKACKACVYAGVAQIEATRTCMNSRNEQAR